MNPRRIAIAAIAALAINIGQAMARNGGFVAPDGAGTSAGPEINGMRLPNGTMPHDPGDAISGPRDATGVPTLPSRAQLLLALTPQEGARCAQQSSNDITGRSSSCRILDAVRTLV
jgi:hypothetical protein